VRLSQLLIEFPARSGIAALHKLEPAGITTAIGIDEAGINDDRDTLMRMLLHAHRVLGMDDEVPACLRKGLG
jgi:5-methylthioadenosine/S-adenosylhomocysteine deaminase